jgi:hypothetical protein
MNKPSFWKVSTIVLAGACAYLATMVQVPSAQSEPQPRMQAALVALTTAKNNLEKASHDKGGHRVAALKYVNNAIDEVKKGIEYDNKHDIDNKKPNPPPIPTPQP